MIPTLSILICSLHDRKHKLQRLLNCLDHQKTPEVEILTSVDDGAKSIGAKRNDLVRRARGDYVAFVDDDDLVSLDYVKLVLEAVETSPDCVGIEGTMTTNGANPKRFSHSIQHKGWYERGGVYYRSVNHLNPVRREIALQVPFKEVNWGEDRDFSERIRPLLKTESFISGPIYYYLYEKAGGTTANPCLIQEVELKDDFGYTATVTVTSLSKSAAGVSFNGSIFGFEGKSGKMFAEGDLFKGVAPPQNNLVREGVPVLLRVTRRGGVMNVWLDGVRVLSVEITDPEIRLGYRPMRGKILVENVVVEDVS